MKRHLFLGSVSAFIIPLFHLTRSDLEPMHSWNRAFADLSFIFLLILLFLGALGRLEIRFKPLSEWKRALGIWSFLLSIPHVIIFLDGWIEWDLRLLFYNYYPTYNHWAFYHGFGLGNGLGIIALFYGVKLAAISNDFSQRILGNSSWNYLQQSTSTFYMLVLIHTAYFLYFHFSTLQRPNPPRSWFNVFFLLSISILFVFRLYVFWFKVRKDKISNQIQSRNLDGI